MYPNAVEGWSGRTPMVTMESLACAALTASRSMRRNADVFSMSWSAGRIAPTAFSPPLRRTIPHATATAAAVSRRQGSATTFSGGMSGSSRRVAAASREDVMTINLSGEVMP